MHCLPSYKFYTQTSSLALLDNETEFQNAFKLVFEPLPHINDLPKDPVARIKLKDPKHHICTWNYACPRKWKDAWHKFLWQHLETGRIHPSDVPVGSGVFIIPKVDPSVLLQWVNDYCQLNTNTITNSFPLPHISDILADCGTGKIFGSIDMTNSFFQTWMHPDDIKLTMVNTPWRLYEWTVMPMGIKNAPTIPLGHQTCDHLLSWVHACISIYGNDFFTDDKFTIKM